jgi:hypothetical protein
MCEIQDTVRREGPNFTLQASRPPTLLIESNYLSSTDLPALKALTTFAIGFAP